MYRRISKTVSETFGRIFSADALSWATVIAIAIGVFLRLYLIFDQVLLDDEWHSLHYVIGKNFGYLLTHFSIPGATCIPLNVYNLALLKSTGWNEFMLRLPSIVAGIVALVIFPVLVRPLLERRSALIFLMFLAISPFLVFYSRVARPYSMVVAFGFASLMFGYYWLTTGRRAHCVAYVLTGVLAVECHLFAFPAVIAPLLTGFLLKSRRKQIQVPRSEEVVPSRIKLALSGGILAALLGLVQGPAVYYSMNKAIRSVAGRDTMTLESVWNAACLLSGTANPVLVAIFTALFLYGFWVLFRKYTLAASMFTAFFVINLALIFFSRPEAINASIVLARYCIIFFPISFLLVAKGLDELLIRLQRIACIHQPVPRYLLSYVLPICFVVVLFYSGPWLQLYQQPNNFTNHSAFQQSYKGFTWDRSYSSEIKLKGYTANTTILQAELSPFYHWLRTNNDADTIVEFPMMIGDNFNPYYYYQHFHKKRVLIGYDRSSPQLFSVDADGNVFGNDYVDKVLNRLADPRAIRFSNMIDMADVEGLRQSGARYIVLHDLFEAEISQFNSAHPRMVALVKLYAQNFGRPVYRDSHLVAFMIK